MRYRGQFLGYVQAVSREAAEIEAAKLFSLTELKMRLLAYQDLRDRGIPYSRPHLWRLVRAGRFPAPIKLTPGGVNLWTDHQIDDLIERRSAEQGSFRTLGEAANAVFDGLVKKQGAA